jgi:hypothetical protein
VRHEPSDIADTSRPVEPRGRDVRKPAAMLPPCGCGRYVAR